MGGRIMVCALGGIALAGGFTASMAILLLAGLLCALFGLWSCLQEGLIQRKPAPELLLASDEAKSVSARFSAQCSRS